MSSKSAEETLLNKIQERAPIVLFLGQDSCASPTVADPVLQLALERVNRAQLLDQGWPALLSATPLGSNFYEWVAEKFERRPLPGWFDVVAKLPWSAIFTSSLDSSLIEGFSSSTREPQVVLTAEEVPLAVRSIGRTPLYYLFGRAGISDAASMPPRDRSEFRVRANLQAIPMLNRLSEAATAVGIVVIDGYVPGRDWLPIDPLLSLIEQMPAQQVIWCGWKDGKVHEDLSALVQSGRILTTAAPLGAFLAELESAGRLNDVMHPASAEAGIVSFANGKSVAVAPEIRIRVEAIASIVDDSWRDFLPPLGPESEYTMFRRFHGDTGGPRALVNGIRYGFAITRQFERSLLDLVNSAIEEHSRFSDPILLHGQSGTGKSIALARLTSRLCEDQRAAILYSSTRIPQSADIEEFCALAEENGATATVMVCDANASVNRYRDLLLGLRSRGRRVVVVGSSYRQVDGMEQHPRTFISASDLLSEAEREQLSDLLKRFGDGTAIKIGHDRNVLATLYRMLPSSRYRLASGLSGEARATEQLLRDRGGQSIRVPPKTAMAEKLIAAGFATENDQVLSERIDDALRSADDSAGRLIDLVMAAGRLNCPVPINLLMRAITTTNPSLDLSLIARMFQGIDLFRWRRAESDSEDLLVSPRLTLEAELICRRRLMNAIGEGAQLIKLVKAARLSWDAGGTERRFLLDLVQKMGPDGPLANRYRESYLVGARALTELRQRFGVSDPNVMLQEAVLRRSAIRESAVDDSERLAILEEAREAVQAAMDTIANRPGRGARRTLANLSVERAAIYGFLATDRAQRSAPSQEVWSAYQAARAAAKSAVAISDTYFPLDVSLWVPANLAASDSLTETQKLELIADINSVLDGIDPMALPNEQRERFNKRLYSIGEQLKFPHLSQQAFDELEAAGSTAGYYLRARGIGPIMQVDKNEDVDQKDRDKAVVAADFLRSSWDKIKLDERCLRYYLQCEWIAAVGQRLFRGERARLPSEEAKRSNLLYVVKHLNETLQPVRDNALSYLEAVLSWISDDEQHALQIWRDLARDTDFIDPRRVVRRHLLTNDRGLPMLFRGRIESDFDGNRYEVRVDSLGQRIQLLGRDFPGTDLGYGRTIASFAIGFNYIGPIADPVRRGGGS